MSGFKCGENGDILIEQNKFSIVTKVDEVKQNLRQNLKTFLGEWFLNTGLGVPYFEDIFIKNPNAISIEAAFKNAILGTIGVRELIQFDLNLDSSRRELSYTFRAVVLDEVIDFSEVVRV